MDPPRASPDTGVSNIGKHTPQPPTFSYLPLELHRMIFLYLRMNDLTICARVSKTWNAIGTPILWRKLSVTTSKQFRRFATGAAQQAVVKNGEHIRELDIEYLSLLDMFAIPIYDSFPDVRRYSAPCTNLQTLCTISSTSYDDMEVDDMVMTLIKHNPLLRTINVYFPCRQQSVQEVINAWGPNLRHLQLWHGIWPRHAKRLLERLPESIEKVAVYIHLANNEKDHDHSATLEQVRPHHSLESVHIVGSFNGYQEYVLLSFLTSCSESLKAFKCPETSCFRNKNICTALARLGLSFKTLHVGELPSGCYSSDADIAQVIFSNPQLASINLDRCHKAGPLTAAAIRDNVNSLNHLDVRSCTSLTSKLLHSILCKARSLKSVKFMDETFESTEGVVLLAVDLVKQKWACSDLEVFQGMIQVPRPMHDDWNDGWDEGMDLFEESWALQRDVFRQLGRLTKLQELRLGQRCEVWEDGECLYLDIFQLNCLDMTLENGLEELIGLKELRLLDVYNMNHGITETERDWMRTHWPKFEELREQGFHNDPPRDVDEEFSMEQEYENLKDQKRVEAMESDAKGSEVENNDEGSGL